MVDFNWVNVVCCGCVVLCGLGVCFSPSLGFCSVSSVSVAVVFPFSTLQIKAAEAAAEEEEEAKFRSR